jgi:C-terminal processing protease CtpA/Prc
MKRILLTFSAALLLSSCEKAFLGPDKGSKDPLANFDYLWEEVDKKYSYFELKKIDWNKVRDTYRPLLNAESSEEELFKVLGGMLNELRDDHTNLISPFNVSVYNVALRTGKVNYYPRIVQEFYLKDQWITGTLTNGFLDSNRVGYIRYGAFTDEFTDEQLDVVINRFKDTRGIILDIRSNGGGSVFNVPKILSRFVENKTLCAYSVTRNGPEHNNFGERKGFFITPYEGTRYNKKVMVLIDRSCYSASTFFSQITKELPNITLVGDTTGGGGGLPNGGQLPNGWTYRFSVSQLLDLNGNNTAEIGVPPDIYVALDPSMPNKDAIIDRAILELK